MPKLKLSIPDDQKARLVQALVTLLTVLLGIALTLGTQVVDQLISPGPSDAMQSLGTTHFTAISAEDLTATDDLTVADDADVNGSLTVGSGNLYPLGIASDGYGIYCNQSTFTGTHVITTATHGLTTPAVVLASLASAPDDDAGDPFIAYTIWAGSTVTVSVAQDDGTAAASAATVDYCVLGVD